MIDVWDIIDFELVVILIIWNLKGEKIYLGEIYSFSNGRMKWFVFYDFSMKDVWKNKWIVVYLFEIKVLYIYENWKLDLVIFNVVVELFISNEYIKEVVKRVLVMVVIVN